jgi:hypothetical protein
MKNNFLKGLIMTIVALLASYFSDNIESGIDWVYLLITTLGITATYIGKNYTFHSNSKFFGLNLNDLYSGLLIAGGTSISSFLASLASTGGFDKIALIALGKAVLIAVAGYISKTLFSNSSGQVLKV